MHGKIYENENSPLEKKSRLDECNVTISELIKNFETTKIPGNIFDSYNNNNDKKCH